MRIFLACAFLLASPVLARAAEPISSAALQDARVMEVVFEGRALDESVRQRFNQLKGRPFRAADLRALLLWVHEHGGESLVEVSADSVRGGVRVRVRASQRSKIEALAFEGNAAVSSLALQPVTELKEGYDFEASAAGEAVRKIGLFYSKQGYLATEVSYAFEPANGRLLFKISEGQPTLLASLGISPLEVIERKELRARYERDLRELFGLKVGDRIQRERVLDGIQAIKDWLRDHDFLMARDPALEYRVNEQGEVGLFLNIQYGSRIRFGFRGNTHFSYRELMTLVGEIKEVSSGADYLVSVRRRVVEAYRAIGFANAQITTLVREDPAQGIRHVSLIVNEGEKTPITSIRIEGVYSMPESEAIRRFQSFGTRLVQRSFFDEEGINKAAELFAEYLKSTGYLSAKVELVKIDFNDTRTKVALSLLFNEGIRTQLQEVKVNGAHSIPEAEVVQLLGLKQGEPFDIFAFERGLVALKENYRDLGHLNAQITNESADNIVRYSRDNSQVSIELEIDEGPLFKVGEVTVRGNQKTHARVVLRELPFIPGDILTTPLLNEAEDGLRRLNLFSSVTVRPVDRPGSSDIKDLLVLVEEGEAGSFDIVPGFRNDLGFRLGFEFGYQNLGGWNRSVNARAVFNRRIGNSYNFPEYSFSVGFREPYLANWPVALTSNLSVFRRQFPSFDADVSRITVGLRRDLTRYLSGILEYGFERVKITNAKEPYSKDKDERLDFIGSVTPGFVFDSRNDQFNPTRGFQSVSRFEVASRFFGSKESVGYYRFTSFNTAYIGLFDWAVLGLGMNWGWARSNVLNERIPTFKLFRLGGISSIRGYAEEQIVVETKNDITGVLGSFNPRAELRIPLAGNVGTALFVDAGNLYIDRFTFQPNKMRSSYGLGLRYTTPVGPVTLDFAWKMQRDDQVGDTIVNDSGSDPMRIHFSIGNF